MKKIIFLSIGLILLAVISCSAYQLWDINQSTVQETQLHNRLMQYRLMPMPLISDDSVSESSAITNPAHTEPAPHINQSIVDLQVSYPDTVGWLTVPNTRIDYPFVQGVDNDNYLQFDLDQKWSAAGTVFMDFRNNRGLSDFNTIIYGHHMQSGSMFGTLQSFNDQAFFDANRTGTIFLSDRTYEIEFMTFAVIRPNDAVIYNPWITTDADKTAFLDYVSTTARHWRDIGLRYTGRLYGVLFRQRKVR